MGVTNFDGPLIAYGNMAALAAGYGSPVIDPNLDASPSLFFQGEGIPDVRYPFLKDRVQGYTGVVPSLLHSPSFATIDTIPITASTTNLANTQAGTQVALVMASASVTGVTVGIPIIPQSTATPPVFGLNAGTAISTTLLLDYGFAFGNVTSASKSVTVADSSQFIVGMPIIIADVGASSAGTPLLTYVTGITSSTVITINDAPLRSANPTPIGAGNIWGPSENGFIAPTAHLPYLAGGVGLFLDPAQTLSRNVQVTAQAAATATTLTVVGYDMYWQRQTEAITISAGATVQGIKTFKAILSATLNATDAGHTYSLGTGDLFGFAIRSDRFEQCEIFYNSAGITANTGYTAAVTSTATSTTGDVRGKYNVQTASNGSVASLALSGRRLTVFQTMPLWNVLQAMAANPQFMYGVTPA